MPDVPGLPTAVFGTSLRLVATPGAGPSAATFDLRVDLPEESQHSDLPVGDPDVVLVFPVTATVESGQLSTIDGSDFRVFDAGGTACNSTEDPLGYTPLVGAELTAGASVSGILAHRMPRSLHDFTVVYFVSGVAAAVWR